MRLGTTFADSTEREGDVFIVALDRRVPRRTDGPTAAAVPSTVVVSSVYRGDARQASRLVDGDLTSAWNSRTGDLEGAWVEIQLPDDARIQEVWLTVGFPRSNGTTDLFTGNHRIAEVRITR